MILPLLEIYYKELNIYDAFNDSIPNFITPTNCISLWSCQCCSSVFIQMAFQKLQNLAIGGARNLNMLKRKQK